MRSIIKQKPSVVQEMLSDSSIIFSRDPEYSGPIDTLDSFDDKVRDVVEKNVEEEERIRRLKRTMEGAPPDVRQTIETEIFVKKVKRQEQLNRDPNYKFLIYMAGELGFGSVDSLYIDDEQTKYLNELSVDLGRTSVEDVEEITRVTLRPMVVASRDKALDYINKIVTKQNMSLVDVLFDETLIHPFAELAAVFYLGIKDASPTRITTQQQHSTLKYKESTVKAKLQNILATKGILNDNLSRHRNSFNSYKLF